MRNVLVDEQGDGVVRFQCAVEKVQTLTDGGMRVWLSLPETALLAAAQLMACQQHGVYLSAELVPQGDEAEIEADTNGDYWDRQRND